MIEIMAKFIENYIFELTLKLTGTINITTQIKTTVKPQINRAKAIRKKR